MVKSRGRTGGDTASKRETLWGDPSRVREFRRVLLAWYRKHGRSLPWRETSDPYRIWISEIMLQQTTVSAVRPYFRAFVEKWPTVADLAAAPIDDVMKAWAGLGYYSRARNLKACANRLAELGGFPDTEAGLLKLPGVGPYTAAAIASIAFDRPAAVVDGNVERVVSRLYAIATPLPDAKIEIKARVAKLVPSRRAGDFAQATMDLGATICTPKRPRCMLCPVREDCRALKAGDPEMYPVRGEKADKPARCGAAFVAVRRDGAILLRKRPEKGLLGGMSEVPTTAWTARNDGATGTEAAPFPANWVRKGSISHVFTHFSLDLTIYAAEVDFHDAPSGHFWSRPGWINDEALPTVMKKAIEAALPGVTQQMPR